VSLQVSAGLVHGSSNEKLIRQNVRVVPRRIIPKLQIHAVAIRRDEADLLCECSFGGIQRIRIRESAGSGRPSLVRFEVLPSCICRWSTAERLTWRRAVRNAEAIQAVVVQR